MCVEVPRGECVCTVCTWGACRNPIWTTQPSGQSVAFMDCVMFWFAPSRFDILSHDLIRSRINDSYPLLLFLLLCTIPYNTIHGMVLYIQEFWYCTSPEDCIKVPVLRKRSDASWKLTETKMHVPLSNLTKHFMCCSLLFRYHNSTVPTSGPCSYKMCGVRFLVYISQD